jgi:6-phosphofructo-2-kinase / fructose-2,6-biphosphatase 2
MLPFEKKTWKSLDELDAGVCDGMTYEEIEEKYPEDYEARDEDKFNYRYRGGESYRDVVVRLEPVIMELERQENILIIGHQVRGLEFGVFVADSIQGDSEVTVRVFLGITPGRAALYQCTNHIFRSVLTKLIVLQIPLHTLIKITPMAYGCHEERYALPIAAVDTHRPKPSKNGKVADAHGEPAPVKSTARDYFGDAGKDTDGAEPKSAVQAVSDALKRDQEIGDLTPKAATKTI